MLVGLSLTGTPSKDAVLAVIEPNASPVSERMAVLSEARHRGLRTFGMLCPLMPGIGNSPEDIDTLMAFLQECGVEEVFSEAVNQRGPGLKVHGRGIATGRSFLPRQMRWHESAAEPTGQSTLPT